MASLLTRRAAILCLTALLPVAPALADLDPGVFVSRNVFGGTYESAAQLGTGPGLYQATLTGTAAELDWTLDGMTFTGSCAGSPTVTCRSQGIATFDLASTSTFAISYDFHLVAAASNQVGWALVDLSSGDTVAALSYDGTDGTSTGGVAVATAGDFSMSVAAGSYLLAVLAECGGSGGSFSMNATFAAVPGPGAVTALAIVGVLGRGRRRR